MKKWNRHEQIKIQLNTRRKFDKIHVDFGRRSYLGCVCACLLCYALTVVAILSLCSNFHIPFSRTQTFPSSKKTLDRNLLLSSSCRLSIYTIFYFIHKFSFLSYILCYLFLNTYFNFIIFKIFFVNLNFYRTKNVKLFSGSEIAKGQSMIPPSLHKQRREKNHAIWANSPCPN